MAGTGLPRSGLRGCREDRSRRRPGDLPRPCTAVRASASAHSSHTPRTTLLTCEKGEIPHLSAGSPWGVPESVSMGRNVTHSVLRVRVARSAVVSAAALVGAVAASSGGLSPDSISTPGPTILGWALTAPDHVTAATDGVVAIPVPGSVPVRRTVTATGSTPTGGTATATPATFTPGGRTGVTTATGASTGTTSDGSVQTIAGGRTVTVATSTATLTSRVGSTPSTVAPDSSRATGSSGDRTSCTILRPGTASTTQIRTSTARTALGPASWPDRTSSSWWATLVHQDGKDSAKKAATHTSVPSQRTRSTSSTSHDRFSRPSHHSAHHHSAHHHSAHHH